MAAEFARHTGSRQPKESGAFLEGFLRGGSEVLLQDEHCCSYSTLGYASSVKQISRTLFPSSAEACRTSIRLRAVACSKRFGADANKDFSGSALAK